MKNSNFDNINFSLKALRKLPSALRSGESATSFWIDNARGRIFDIRSINTKGYGLAVDLGTTTVDILLVDITNGDIKARASAYNQQMTYGSDIIHRIIAAGKKSNLKNLKKLALRTINDVIDGFCAEMNIQPEEIAGVSLAGNTTMIHLLLQIDPANIRLHPYVPATTEPPVYSAGEIGIKANNQAPVFIAPGVSSYVGGDIVSGLNTVDFTGELTLYLDLGTNGEIVIGDGNWFAGCACSCGPAFEGGEIACGMRACPGAAEKIEVLPHGSLRMETIGGKPPIGICGSGLIDLLAGLYENHIIDGKGKFKLSSAADELITARGRRKALTIKFSNEKISLLDEAEIDNMIRTKGALMAGIRCLLKELALQISSIERVLVAGNFGQHLNMENAIRIGLLPDLPRNRFIFLGNASLKGAYCSLLSAEHRDKVKELSNQVTNIELSTFPGYHDEFIAACFLPHTDYSLFPSVCI